MASLIVLLLTLAAGVAGQVSPYSRLLITARGSTPGQSLVYGVDARSGVVQTLFNEQQGTFVDIAMDRDNVHYTVVYEGLHESGLHFLEPQGSQSATLVNTCRETNPDGFFRCADIGVEDVWLIGTGEAEGYGRIRSLIPGGQVFTDIANFQGLEVTEMVIERKTGNFVFALNGTAGGVLYSYSYAIPSKRQSVTLASGLAPILDLVADPNTGGFLLATQSYTSPLLFVDSGAASNGVKSFSLPQSVLPLGNMVDALALDTRADGNGDCALWILSADDLHRITWNVFSRTIRIPSPVPTYKLPSRNPTAMIFEGDREFLLSTQIEMPRHAALTMRLGPRYADLQYVIAASFSMSPGIPVSDSRMINLTPGPLFILSLMGDVPGVFDDLTGKTGPTGEATGKVKGDENLSQALHGVPIYFAGVVIDPAVPGKIRTITNTVGLILF